MAVAKKTKAKRADGARPSPTQTANWYVYLLECRDGSIYTGIAIDVAKRYAEHVSGKGARYTRSHPPLRLLATLPCPNRSAATSTELRIKRMKAAAKRALCATW